MFRIILYIVLGALVGAFLSTIPLIAMNVSNLPAILVILLSGGLLGGYTGVRIAKSINVKEQNIISQNTAPTSERSVYFVAGAIVGMEFLVTLLGYVTAWVVLKTQYSGEEINAMAADGSYLIVGILLSIIVFSSWVGVKYVVAKKYLSPAHEVNNIALQVFGFNFIIYFSVQNILGGLISATLSTLIVFYFLRRHKKQS